jgi:hypothetical protein
VEKADPITANVRFENREEESLLAQFVVLFYGTQLFVSSNSTSFPIVGVFSRLVIDRAG